MGQNLIICFLLQELPVGDWFCCSDCERINSFLKNLIEGGEQKLPDHLNDVVKKKVIEKDSSVSDLEVTWRVLNGGKLSLDEMRPFLSKAVSVFHVSLSPFLFSLFLLLFLPRPIFCSLYLFSQPAT